MLHVRLVALAALSALSVTSAAQGPAPATQTINLSNFAIAPVPIRLAAGHPVTLTFVNQSGGSHDFTAKDFFAKSQITAGAAPGGKIDLKAHETKTITLVPAAGTYEAHCSHFLHASMGMHDQIIVG